MDFRVIQIILVALVIGVCRVKADFKYNVSLAQMDTCRHYMIPMIRGYNYADFFHIPHMEHNKLAENELLHLKFYVMTARDAHILLSVTDHPRLSDRVYEIVIGAGRNSFSTIRTNMGRRRVATNQEPNILSLLDPTPVEIIQTKDANLAVYISGYKEEPLMNFTDTSPLDINYLSFTTYDNIPASWFFDCQFDGFATEIEEEVRPMTPHQQLVAHLSARAQNASFPPDMKSVEFNFKFASVNYQHDRAIMQTRLSLTLQWNDPRLTWDPQDYGLLNVLQYTTYNIWLPELHIINAALNAKPLLDSEHRIKIRNSGNISLIFNDIVINTWCPNPKGNWPSEQLKCDIILGLDQGPLEKLPLVDTHDMVHKSIESLSEWKCFRIGVTSVDNGNLARFTPKQILQTMDGDIVLKLDIGRNGQFYKNVFSMPILACQILIILSFLLRGYRRGALILVVVFVQMLGLMFIAKHAPKPYVPDMMSAYQHILRIATFCYMWHICLMWLELYPPKSKPNDWLNAVMNYSPLRLMLCMRLSNTDDFIEAQQHPWKEVAKILNSFCFVVVNVIFILIVCFLLPHA